MASYSILSVGMYLSICALIEYVRHDLSQALVSVRYARERYRYMLPQILVGALFRSEFFRHITHLIVKILLLYSNYY